MWSYQPDLHKRSNFNAERTRRKMYITTIFYGNNAPNRISSLYKIDLLQKKLKKKIISCNNLIMKVTRQNYL